MALWTTAGINLVATAISSTSANAAIRYVGLSLGCGTLNSPLTTSNSYTSLPLDGTLPANLSAGQTLTITDGTHSQNVITSAPVSAGASSIPVIIFTALNSYAAHTTGVAPAPQSGDVALYGESVRFAVLTSGAGAGAGESLTSGYADGTQATGVYMMVGYFGGSSATSSTGTGTLMIEDVSYWNHTVNADSNMYQADSTI